MLGSVGGMEVLIGVRRVSMTAASSCSKSLFEASRRDSLLSGLIGEFEVDEVSLIQSRGCEVRSRCL